jgi:hypothetical protein
MVGLRLLQCELEDVGVHVGLAQPVVVLRPVAAGAGAPLDGLLIEAAPPIEARTQEADGQADMDRRPTGEPCVERQTTRACGGAQSPCLRSRTALRIVLRLRLASE